MSNATKRKVTEEKGCKVKEIEAVVAFGSSERQRREGERAEKSSGVDYSSNRPSLQKELRLEQQLVTSSTRGRSLE